MLQCLASIHRNKRWEVLKGNSSKRSHPGLCTCYSAGCFQSKLRSENSTHILNQFGKQAVILLQYITIFTHSYNNHLKNGYFQSHLKNKKKSMKLLSKVSVQPPLSSFPRHKNDWFFWLSPKIKQKRRSDSLWLSISKKWLDTSEREKSSFTDKSRKKLFLERKKFGEIRSKIMRRRN